MKQATIAYQIEVRSPPAPKQVYFVGSESEKSALAALRTYSSLPASSEMRIVRSLGSAAIQQFELRPGTIFKWI